MRLSDCTPGTIVYHGASKHLKNGQRGCKAIILDVGTYTTIYTEGCPGVGVQLAERASKRVVIAVGRDHSEYDPQTGDRKKKPLWRAECTTVASLMLAEEYEVKEAALETVQAAARAHDADGERILQEIAVLVQPHLRRLAFPAASVVHHNWAGKNRKSRIDLLIPDIDLCDPAVQKHLPTAVTTKLVRLIAEHDAWRTKKSPASC